MTPPLTPPWVVEVVKERPSFVDWPQVVMWHPTHSAKKAKGLVAPSGFFAYLFWYYFSGMSTFPHLIFAFSKACEPLSHFSRWLWPHSLLWACLPAGSYFSRYLVFWAEPCSALISSHLNVTDDDVVHHIHGVSYICDPVRPWKGTSEGPWIYL